MPDTKFSWRALREHIRKYLWIYLAGIALCLVGTNLLWTTTRPRADIDETVTVYLADAYSDPAPLSDIAARMLERVQAEDETLKEVSFESLMYTENDYNSTMLLVTRLSVGEADAFLASQAVMDALVPSDILEPLDGHIAAGWLGEYGLEPYTVTVEDEETGTSKTYVAGLRLDSLNQLVEMGAFGNAGAYLCVTTNGGNLETTMRALEVMLEELTRWQPEEAEDA